MATKKITNHSQGQICNGGVSLGDQTFRALIEALPDGVVVSDAARRVVVFNKAATGLLLYEPAMIMGRPVTSLLADPDAAAVDFFGAVVLEEGGITLSRHLVTCRRGDDTLVTLGVAATRLLHGEHRVFIALLRDMNNAFIAGSEEIEARLGSIVANLPGIVFQRIQGQDGSLYYPFFSVGVCDILGMEPEDMHITHDGCLDVIHWADRDDHLTAVRHSARELSPCHETFRAITRAGEVIWLRGMSRPARLPGGEVLWDGVLIDVTGHKRAEHNLEIIMNHAYDSIVTINEAGLILSVNAATGTLFGHAITEMLGRNVSMLMPDPFRGAHDTYITRYIQTGESRIIGAGPGEFEGQRRDGSRFPLEMALSEVRMEGRRIFIAVMRDITHRKKTEAALRETEQLLLNIAANLPGMVFQRVLRADGRLAFTFLSGGCRDVLGMTPEQLCADPDFFFNAVNPYDREQFIGAYRASARTMEPVEDEFRIATPIGNRWLRGWSRPRKMDDGTVV